MYLFWTFNLKIVWTIDTYLAFANRSLYFVFSPWLKPHLPPSKPFPCLVTQFLTKSKTIPLIFIYVRLQISDSKTQAPGVCVCFWFFFFFCPCKTRGEYLWVPLQQCSERAAPCRGASGLRPVRRQLPAFCLPALFPARAAPAGPRLAPEGRWAPQQAAGSPLAPLVCLRGPGAAQNPAESREGSRRRTPCPRCPACRSGSPVFCCGDRYSALHSGVLRVCPPVSGPRRAGSVRRGPWVRCERSPSTFSLSQWLRAQLQYKH